MKKIKTTPQYKLTTPPAAGANRVQSRGIEKIGVPTARGARIPNMQTNRYGDRALQKGFEDLGAGLKAVERAETQETLTEATLEYQQLERGRKAGVLSHTIDAESMLNDKQDGMRGREGSNALGMTKQLAGEYDKMLDTFLKSRGENLDEKSKAELTQNFKTAFTKKLLWSQGREIAQAEVGEANAKKTSLDNGVKESLRLEIGDTSSVEYNADVVMADWLYIEGENMSNERYEQGRKQVMEKLLSTAFDRWLTHDPSNARKLWAGRPEYFKANMPNMYNTMNHKVEIMKKDALVDSTYKRLLAKNGVDYLASMKEVIDPAFIEKHMDGDYSSAMSVAQNLSTTYNANAARQTKATAELEDKAITDIFNANQILNEKGKPTGTFNSASAISALVIAARQGKVDGTKASQTIIRWRTEAWTAEDNKSMYVWMAEKAAANTMPTDGEIIMRANGGAPIASYIAFKDRLISDKQKGLGGVNYLQVARGRFQDEVSSLGSPAARRKLRVWEEIYVDMVHEHMVSEKLTFYDRRLFDYAQSLLKTVTQQRSGELLSEEETGFSTDYWGTTKDYRFKFGSKEPTKVGEVDESTIPPEVLKFMDDKSYPKTPKMIDAATKYLEDQKTKKD